MSGPLSIVLRGLIIVAAVVIVSLPLVFEYITFRRDRKNKIAHKRFRLFLFAIVYAIVITVILAVSHGLLHWVMHLSFIVWLTKKISFLDRINYATSVYAVLFVNLAIGVLFRITVRLVRIRMAKRELVIPEGKEGKYSILQRIERAIIRFFYKETWFFANEIIRITALVLSITYAVLFTSYQIPVIFHAAWFPYVIMNTVFDHGYLYPIITLIPLWEFYFFLCGVEHLEEECVSLLEPDEIPTGALGRNIVYHVDKECRRVFTRYFRKRFKANVKETKYPNFKVDSVTQKIAESAENGNPLDDAARKGYRLCLDRLIRADSNSILNTDRNVTNCGVVVNGDFFSDFTRYFIGYLGIILARGDNVIFVCKNHVRALEVESYLKEALENTYSLQHKLLDEEQIKLNGSVWRMCVVEDENDGIGQEKLRESSILITDLSFLCTATFERNYKDFICLTDTVVYVDTADTINTSSQQMVLLNYRMNNIRRESELAAINSSEAATSSGEVNKNFARRYVLKGLKYVCYDNVIIPGIDRALNNLLSIEFVTVNAMVYNFKKLIMCLYDYEGRVDAKGDVEELLPTTAEELGILSLVANHAVKEGNNVIRPIKGEDSATVSVYAEAKIPYGDMMESSDANVGSEIAIQTDRNYRVNKPVYASEGYNLIVAFDDADNLPAAIRKFASRKTKDPSLIMLFSRPYMLRDYYVANVDRLWKDEQIVRTLSVRNVRSVILRTILTKASSGGISVDELLGSLNKRSDLFNEEFLEAIGRRDVAFLLKAILREVFTTNGKAEDAEDYLRYFEFKTVRDFDRRGTFSAETKILLREQGSLYELINCRNMIRVKIAHKTKPDPLPLTVDRLSQNFISGQNMLYNGRVYQIERITDGVLYVGQPTDGNNRAPYQYVQDREYHIDWSNLTRTANNGNYSEPLDNYEIVILQNLGNEQEMAVGTANVRSLNVGVSVSRRPMEVVTNGFFSVDWTVLSVNGVVQNTDDTLRTDNYQYLRKDSDGFRQTYRNYGGFRRPEKAGTSGRVMDPYIQSLENAPISRMTSSRGAKMLSIRVSGELGKNPERIAMLAAAMIGEILRSMYPSASDCIAVCPIIPDVAQGNQRKDVENLRRRLPRAYCYGYEYQPNAIELLIVEDCASDVGVISSLRASGEVFVKQLFQKVSDYLNWYSQSKTKSNYLYYGMSKEPDCFDFDGLRVLAEALAR